MTVLSRALTAETPDERIKALIYDIVAIQAASHGEAMAVATVEQFYTNERLLFTHSAIVVEPTMSPASKVEPDTPSGAPVGGATTPAAGTAATLGPSRSAQSTGLLDRAPENTPPAPKSNGHPRTCLCNDCAKLEGLETKSDGRVDYIQSMTVEDAKAALGPSLGLSEARFKAWQKIAPERRKAASSSESGYWPYGYANRLATLERLSPSERYWLVKA